MRQMTKNIIGLAGFKLERVRPRRWSLPTHVGPSENLEEIDDLVFRIGDWRYEIPLSKAVGRPCFGYGPDSWHPYVAAVKELLEEPKISYDDSVLKRHFEEWQPRSVAESHFPGELSPHPILERIPAPSLFEPWLRRPPPCDEPLNPRCRPAGSPLFGPLTPERGKDELHRLRRTLRSIERYGYQPDGFPRGLIKVAVLRHAGENRYLIAHGQHRAAVLAALDQKNVVVGIHRELPPLIDSGEAPKWPHVVDGTLDSSTALAMLERFFILDGKSTPFDSIDR